MVEAAMVLPILILVVFSLLLVMVYYFESHQSQMDIHKALLLQAQESQAVFHIEKQSQKNQTRLDGMVDHVLVLEKHHRIYCLRPARWVQLGEMTGLTDE